MNESNHGTQIQAVFLDIDGTIFYNGEVVQSAKDAVSQLVQRQIPVAICTGRSILHARKVQDEVNLKDAVYFNGGLAVSKEQVIASHPLTPEVVQRTIAFSTTNQLPIILHSRTRTIIFEPFPEKYRPILVEYDYPPLEQVLVTDWNATEEPVYQVNMFATNTWDQRVQNEFPECLLYRWSDHAVDLQKRGCDKIMGAKALLKEWGISPAHALHIGDGGNDVGMFQELGYSVVMGNATDEVKQHASIITARVQDDGVYKALQALNLIP